MSSTDLELDGRRIDPKYAVAREEMSREFTASPVRSARTNKIFVGGVAPETQEADFRSHFERFGRLSDAIIMVDHNTNRSRGFGFVTFGTCALSGAFVFM